MHDEPRTGRLAHGTARVADALAPLTRDAIPEGDRWNLTDIYPDWTVWEAGLGELSEGIDRFAALQGSLAKGAERLHQALRASDELGQLAYKVYYFTALRHDEDQRDNDVTARRQQVQHLLTRWRQATAWFNPELLAIPIETVQAWLESHPDLAVYRFALESLYRQQEHVLDEAGERLLALATQTAETPDEAYSALSTADVRFPTITLASGEQVSVTYGQYRAILATNRNQADRAEAFRAHHGVFQANLNTYAALYRGVLERDWFLARSRRYPTTLDAALHGNAIPRAVVETLIETGRGGTAPWQRYERLRRRVLGGDGYHVYDGAIPLIDFDRRYDYHEIVDWVIEAAAPLGDAYQRRLREGFASRWIDVFETPGKRSGAYSAPVYGVHPYVLLNYNATLDSVFTVAHEMGHSMHTLLAHEHQPFVYSDYTIFVAEVPSTLAEALLLEYLLERSEDRAERIVLLQHAIDELVGTFYTQVLFADYELEAHRLVEQGEPVTADVLGELYFSRLRAYHGDALDYDELSRVTWARIPHFYHSPYYVYQYATCYASTARLLAELKAGDRAPTIARYLGLLQAGGSDYPMRLLHDAGVDLEDPATVGAVVHQLDTLVTRLETELRAEGLAD